MPPPPMPPQSEKPSERTTPEPVQKEFPLLESSVGTKGPAPSQTFRGSREWEILMEFTKELQARADGEKRPKTGLMEKEAEGAGVSGGEGVLRGGRGAEHTSETRGEEGGLRVGERGAAGQERKRGFEGGDALTLDDILKELEG